MCVSLPFFFIQTQINSKKACFFQEVTSRSEAHQELNAFRRKQDTALVIRGDSLEVCLEYYEHELMELVALCPAVVACRCSPEQKAVVVRLIERHTGRIASAIGRELM